MKIIITKIKKFKRRLGRLGQKISHEVFFKKLIKNREKIEKLEYLLRSFVIWITEIPEKENQKKSGRETIRDKKKICRLEEHKSIVWKGPQSTQNTKECHHKMLAHQE